MERLASKGVSLYVWEVEQIILRFFYMTIGEIVSSVLGLVTIAVTIYYARKNFNFNELQSEKIQKENEFEK